MTLDLDRLAAGAQVQGEAELFGQSVRLGIIKALVELWCKNLPFCTMLAVTQ
jgi:hypothetical protein